MAQKVKRFDDTLSRPAFEKTSQGYLRARGVATRVGILVYRLPDGTERREFRPPDEVFHPESLASLKNVPATNEHPPCALLDASNTYLYLKGFTSSRVEHDDAFVNTDVTFTDPETISDIEQGRKKDLSCGYECELDFTPGVYKGERYDASQKKIRYNHLALTKKGRAGSDVSLKLDALDAVAVEPQFKETIHMSKVKIKVDGKEIEVDEDTAKTIQGLQVKLDAAEAKSEEKNEGNSNGDKNKSKKTKNDAKAKPADEDEDEDEDEDDDEDEEDEDKDSKNKKSKKGDDAIQVQLDRMQATCDSQAAELKKLRTGKTSYSDVRQLVQERKRLETVASKVSLDATDIETMDDLELKKAVILAHHSEAKLDAKSVDYISARFDAVAEEIEASDKTARSLGERLNGDSKETRVDSEEARERAMERSKKMGREPLKMTRPGA